MKDRPSTFACPGTGPLLALALLAASTAALAQPSQPPPAVIAARAATTEMVDTIEGLGTVRANESTDIAAKVTEKVVEIRFEDGQQVAAGDVLLQLNDAEEQAQLRAAQAVRVERQNAFDRAAELAGRNVGSKAAQDDARALLLQSDAEIEAIEVRIEDHRVRAPFAGTLGLRNISLGALVEPGDLITTLDDTHVVKVDFAVPASFIAPLRPGLALEGRSSAWPERVFTGAVASIDSRVDPVTRTVVVRATIDNADAALRPGMLMQVQLQASPRTALTIPEEALEPQGSLQYVFLVDENDGNRIVQREVRIGTRMAGRVEVVAGLQAHDLVVTHGGIKVRPGQPVEVRAIDDGTRSVREMLLAKPAASGAGNP